MYCCPCRVSTFPALLLSKLPLPVELLVCLLGLQGFVFFLTSLWSCVMVSKVWDLSLGLNCCQGACAAPEVSLPWWKPLSVAVQVLCITFSDLLVLGGWQKEAESGLELPVFEPHWLAVHQHMPQLLDAPTVRMCTWLVLVTSGKYGLLSRVLAHAISIVMGACGQGMQLSGFSFISFLHSPPAGHA